eukprot:837810_1
MTECTLAEIVAAWCYWKKCDDGVGFRSEPAASKRIKHLSNIYSQMSPVMSTTQIKLPLKRIKRSNHLLNIVENIHNDHSIHCLISKICNPYLSMPVDLSLNATEKCYSYNYSSKCIVQGCDGRLKSNYVSLNSSNKGAIAVEFHHLCGPRTAMSYTSHCVKCKAKYTFGSIEAQDGAIYFLPLNEQIYQDKYSFYSTDLFYLFGDHSNKEGNGAEFYCNIFNKTHRMKRKKIQQKLEELKQTLGKRHLADPLMKSPDLVCISAAQRHAYVLSRNIQTALLSRHKYKIKPGDIGTVVAKDIAVDFASGLWVKIELHHSLSVQRNNICVDQQNIIFLRRNCVYFAGDTLADDELIWKFDRRINASDQFNILYEQYESKINGIFPTILNVVPISECGSVHTGHGCTYGDGNAHGKLQCKIGPQIYQKWFGSDTNAMSTTFVCTGIPDKGNFHAMPFKTCTRCATCALTRTSLTKENLNDFVDYCFLIDKHERSGSIKNKQAMMKIINKRWTLNQQTYFTNVRVHILGDSKPKCDLFVGEDPFASSFVPQLDEIGGDRKGSNIANISEHATTYGIMSIFTLSGFCIDLSEIAHSESPTVVIRRTNTIYTASNEALNFFCIFIEIFGWDFMCNILRTLLSKRVTKLIETCHLVKLICYFWDKITPGAFIDPFHVAPHTKPICQNDEEVGLLHTGLAKFKPIFEHGKINHQKVEQFWRFTNKCKAWRLCRDNKFRFLLWLRREYENHANKQTLEKDGYTWCPLNDFKRIRNCDFDEIPSDFKMKTVSQLRKIKCIRRTHRIYFGSIASKYWNIWEHPAERQPIYKTSQTLLALHDLLKTYIDLLKTYIEQTVTLDILKPIIIEWHLQNNKEKKPMDAAVAFYNAHTHYVLDILRVYAQSTTSVDIDILDQLSLNVEEKALEHNHISDEDEPRDFNIKIPREQVKQQILSKQLLTVPTLSNEDDDNDNCLLYNGIYTRRGMAECVERLDNVYRNLELNTDQCDIDHRLSHGIQEMNLSQANDIASADNQTQTNENMHVDKESDYQTLEDNCIGIGSPQFKGSRKRKLYSSAQRRQKRRRL